MGKNKLEKNTKDIVETKEKKRLITGKRTPLQKIDQIRESVVERNLESLSNSCEVGVSALENLTINDIDYGK